MNIKSSYLCPCCGKNLRLETPHVSANNVILYCGHGPCKVYEMNNGEQAENEAAAYQKLVNQLEYLTDLGRYMEPTSGWFYRRNDRLPYLRPTGVNLSPAPLSPTSPNWENSEIAKLAQPTFEEMTGSD